MAWCITPTLQVHQEQSALTSRAFQSGQFVGANTGPSVDAPLQDLAISQILAHS